MRIKICGLTNPEDVRALEGLGVDAVGFNFCDGSPRRIDPPQAAGLIDAMPNGLLAVGVFADMPAAHVAEQATRLGITTVQLHGDEPPEHVRLLQAADLAVIKAFRLGEPEHLAHMEAWLQIAQTAPPDAILIDAAVPGVQGGSGRAIATSMLQLLAARLHRWDQLLPTWRNWTWILAGGLNPENLSERIALCPLPISMIDTASGVEAAPGRKDPKRIAAFVEAAHAPALARVDGTASSQ